VKNRNKFDIYSFFGGFAFFYKIYG